MHKLPTLGKSCLVREETSSFLIVLTSYDTPLSVPASQGYKFSSLSGSQVPSPWQSSNLVTPRNQSGDG